ncbi:MAG TPA: sigma 54-interacting transcriptional regulator [Deltaproteobacteria bacterium]|nr:sigma 54-interacting transcriptional regulator [Deltaproteobacteria bacterium]HPR54027.1 sigma 54-interacting transcriptional regulator [Deltaproteobacteria bacterium]HXK48504.1 sigma 54-interacting transcriptional regulator [Deltaproteobacteria bacterium]
MGGKRSGLPEKKAHGTFEDFLASMSARLVALEPEQIDDEIQKALGECLHFFGIDRLALVRLLPCKTKTVISHNADRLGTSPYPTGMVLPVSLFPWIARKLIDREVISYARPEELPTEADVDKQSLEMFQVRSGTYIPIAALRSSEYMLGISLSEYGQACSPKHIPKLRLLGELIVNALERSKAELELRERLAEIERLKSQLEQENIVLRDEIKAGMGTVIGDSDTLKYVLFRVKQVAPTDATVLILGETGTGKSMVANALHEMSTRRNKPMITVNCAALPANLIESELFGREKGAFTGAHAKQIGRFEIAHGGTIFLDEIGEMPLELQAKLLRVLQDGEFERLGSPRTVKVDVRVIASTCRDLKAEVRNKRFREDLYYRLNVFPVSIPPLSRRIEDIPLLVEHFIDKYARKLGKTFASIPKGTMRALQEYHWPGNVRELEHVIERAVIISPGPVLHLADQLDFETAPMEDDGSKQLEAVEREHILRVLHETRWRIEGKGGAAAVLGLNPSTLRFRIRRLGIERP